MKRRDFVENAAIVSVVSVTGILTGILTSCGGNVLTWVGIVIQSLTEALPIFTDLIPGSADIVKKAIAVAKELETAIKNRAPNTIDFLEQLISPSGLFNQILDSVGVITDPAQKRIVSGILALAGVALRLIAAGLHQGATQTPQGPEIIAKARTANAAGVAHIEKVAVQDSLEKSLSGLRF